MATTEAVTLTREQTRARYPDESGFVEREGVRTYYEVYGDGEPTVLLLPTWSIVHSRHWKMQIPYLARHCRVVTFDGRGNGRSDRPSEPAAYDQRGFAAGASAGRGASGAGGRSGFHLPRGSDRRARARADTPPLGRRARHRRGL